MGLLDSVKNFVFQKGFEDEYYYDEVDEDDGGYAHESDDISYIDSRRSYTRAPETKKSDTIALPSRVFVARASEKDQVYAMPGANMQIVISAPTDIDAASYVCDLLKQQKTVIVNMEGVEMKDAQRIMDFLAGVAYSIDGDVQPISSRIYVVSPKNVEVSEHFKEQLKANGIFSGLNFKSAFGGRAL